MDESYGEPAGHRERRAVKASRDGTGMAKYKGSTSYLPVTGASDYVDVR